MKPLNHRDIFLKTLDGFFAPLVGAFKGAITEIQRTSSGGRRRSDDAGNREAVAARGDANAPAATRERGKT